MLLEELLVNIVLISWIHIGPIVKGFREYSEGGGGRFSGMSAGSERYSQYSGFEYLNNELRKREKSQ